jgi:hypothetical protein
VLDLNLGMFVDVLLFIETRLPYLDRAVYGYLFGSMSLNDDCFDHGLPVPIFSSSRLLNLLSPTQFGFI